MTLLRRSLLATILAVGACASVFVPGDAQASVSIAVGYDALVKDADAVGVVTPVDAKTVWEEGRIVTYTHVKVDQGVAGELGTGSDGWVRTLGGVVGKIGQLVDGEPVFTANKSSLVFMRKFKSSGTWEVSARAQGQYPIVLDAADGAKPAGQRRVIRSTAVGMLLPPKAAAPANVVTKTDPNGAAERVAQIRLAGEVLHDRPLDEVTRDVAAQWKALHPAGVPAAPATDTKK
ncbi:MAG: hypothetical protein QOI41_50 [Myxococcales bacterium]|jgi:hypothetical protein|nr:hypothetical protein [Myxococcales bacterium]